MDIAELHDAVTPPVDGDSPLNLIHPVRLAQPVHPVGAQVGERAAERRLRRRGDDKDGGRGQQGEERSHG